MSEEEIIRLYQSLLQQGNQVAEPAGTLATPELNRHFNHFQHHYQANAGLRQLLDYLAAYPQTNAKAVSQTLDCLPGTLSKRLHHLMKHGIVQEMINPDNKREHWYQLTPMGQQFYTTMIQQLQLRFDQQADQLSQFSDREQQTIYHFLKAMQQINE
ncbi:MarR family winged helix-turn-helix transcriptional regulator [Levilactobacillus bambusae]|uniref:HTH marR-type domain-containing protein n=1 Tax=Levilactobacillus bambusae TaxID=2024736 RepID=A0A2V1N1V6_9LACO|nr:MarR family winged helix-turn-helix transcriptional regulator [Levilactobacillus bambusae]PWG00316.1 hypothetical protein DCM90_05135 [Levilactobacillus bambusae]